MLAVCPSASCAEQDLIKLAFQFKTHTHIETFEAKEPRKKAKGTPWTGWVKTKKQDGVLNVISTKPKSL